MPEKKQKPIILWTCDVEGWAYHNRFLRLSKNLPDYDHRLYFFGDPKLSYIERINLVLSADVIVCQGVKAIRIARMNGPDPDRNRYANIVGRLDSMRVDYNGEYYDIWTGEGIEK